jgi:sugar phosphate isomerase/epimerase
MYLGISTATYFSKLFTEDSFEEIKKLDIKICEVFLATFFEYQPSFCDTLIQKSKGIRIYSVHALTSQFEPELFNESPRTRKDAENIFDMVLNTAQRLCAKYYTFHGPARLKKKVYEFDYEKLGKRFCELAAMAAAKNVEIAYENVHWSFFNCPEYLLNLKPYCPKIKSVLDIKQAMQNKIDWESLLKAMGNSLVNVHICDYDENGKLCMPGRGIFDFKKFFYKLEDTGYDGPIIIELYPDAYKTFDEIKYCVDYLCGVYPFKT